MAKILKFKRGNTAKNNAYTGSAGELTVDTTKKTVVVHDGVTTGGSVLATEVTVSTHTSRVDNPHGVSKTQVGLGNVLNVDSTNPNNIVQDSTHRFVTDSDKTNWNGKINATEKAVANGVATLDVNGKVVLTQIPDSVLGQLEYMGTYSLSGGMPTATQKGQYWIASADGNGYITGDWAVWNGTSFDKVDNTDAVATVAGRTGNVVLTKNDVGLSNVDNTSDVNKPVSTATQTALNLKANIASPTFTGTVTAPTFSGALSGNASTATKLATARTINGVLFDGSADININTSDTTAVKLTGDQTIAGVKTFSSTIVGNITGNSGTATKLSTTRTNYKDTTDSVVVGELMWKNYGNNHTIFDASNSTTPTGVAKNNTNPENPWSPTYPTLMGYNGGNTYGVRVDSSRYADQLKTARNIALTGAVTGNANFDGSANISITTTGATRTYEAAKSLETNGYMMFTNGLIIQWGTVGTTATTFPIAFPNAGLQVVVQINYNVYDTFTGQDVYVSGITKTGFSRTRYAAGCTWIAIGY